MNDFHHGSTDLLEPLRKKSEEIWQYGVAAILLVLFVITIPGLAVLLVFAWFLLRGKLPRLPRVMATSHGSARWADERNLQEAGCLGTSKGYVIGERVFRRGQGGQMIRVPEHRFPHLSVAGPAGSGKSTAFSILNLLQDDPAGIVVLDPKGENARATAAWRAAHLGHEIVIIDPYGVAGPHPFRPGRLNPLRLQPVAERMILDDARRLAGALVVRTPDEREPFWNNSAQVLIQGMIALLMSAGEPEETHLCRVRDILTNATLTEEALRCMKSLEACGGLLARTAGQLSHLKAQTAASVFGVANSHLEFLDSLPVADVLRETSFDPQALLENRLSIYLCLPVDRLQEMKGLQRVLLTCLINYVFQAGESKTRRVRLLLDEAASLGSIDALYSAIMFGRGYGLRAALLFQSLSQIAICFPDSKANDYKGTVASVFTGVCDFAGAEEVSKWIGQTTEVNYSAQSSTSWGYSTSHGGQDFQRGSNSGGGDSETFSQMGRALIQPEEILQLPSTAAIALLPGIRPVLLTKLPYFRWCRSGAKEQARVPARGTLRCLFDFLVKSAVVIFVVILALLVIDMVTHAIRDRYIRLHPQLRMESLLEDARGRAGWGR